MDTAKLKKFAQAARRQLRDQVTSRLEIVLKTDSAELREKEKALKALREQIDKTSKEAVIERVAYIWFNRFCALRFMDANRYTRISVVSPAEGFTQPEILAEAKQGHIDDSLNRYVDRQKVVDLLAGRAPSGDPQNEAYRMLLVAVCNHYNGSMQYLFDRIADYTELLMPEDLLSESSILNAVIEGLTDEDCKDVEVIGWLYQFYISEKKDEVFDGLKKNKKITPENIPAATQLFTPHWIVCYLVENSLGRLWMLNRPDSRLIEQMDYYIKPEQTETDFLQVSSPEELKVCDPACGSGHMLVYAFDLLYSIYEEEGYQPSEIPGKILTNNLYGIEIDERAGELAAFALTMKARSKYRRFFSKAIQPNICVLENVQFEEAELKSYMDEIGRDLFTADLQTTLHQFKEADNFGSLIQPALTDMGYALELLEEKDLAGDLFLFKPHQKVLRVLRQADYLSSKYHVVIANPPYMGGKGMNGRLKAFLQDNYTAVKSDLFSAFIVRNTELTLPKGQLGFMTPFVWMFISSYEKLRNFLMNQKTISSLVQLEYSGFGGATVPICTFTVENAYRPEFKGGYVRLSNFRGAENQGPKTLEAIKDPDCGWFYRASADDFKKIPSSPIAYWASKKAFSAFSHDSVEEHFDAKKGMAIGDNARFLRAWTEISYFAINRDAKVPSDTNSHRWYPCLHGGAFRKWSSNKEYVVNWKNDGAEPKSAITEKTGDHWSRYIISTGYFFSPGINWTAISSSSFSARYHPHGFAFSSASMGAFAKDSDPKLLLLLVNSTVGRHFFSLLSPTLNYGIAELKKIPYIFCDSDDHLTGIVDKLVYISSYDWNSYETSWDFTILPLLHPNYCDPSLKTTYNQLRDHWREMTDEMQELEEENNRIFIEAYRLQDELTPEVPLKEITLTCNPHYRYNSDKSEEELEALLLADTMKDLISYAVSCMFGRYSLDKPGLILANQEETIEGYLELIPTPTFPADDDNVIPMLDGDWFTDDISERFRKFLRLTFGEEHYEENLKYVENSLGKDIRKYFLKDFYNDHVKRYKKRPIYWLFSSPKGSFNALIYMHRYRPDTVSIVLNDYLREFRTKLTARKNHLEEVSISASASKTEKTKALKEIEKLKKMIVEMEDYEREVLYPLATEQVEIDLDDGVKVNYNKFGKALKKVTGLSGKGGKK